MRSGGGGGGGRVQRAAPLPVAVARLPVLGLVFRPVRILGSASAAALLVLGPASAAALLVLGPAPAAALLVLGPASAAALLVLGPAPAAALLVLGPASPVGTGPGALLPIAIQVKCLERERWLLTGERRRRVTVRRPLDLDLEREEPRPFACAQRVSLKSKPFLPGMKQALGFISTIRKTNKTVSRSARIHSASACRLRPPRT